MDRVIKFAKKICERDVESLPMFFRLWPRCQRGFNWTVEFHTRGFSVALAWCGSFLKRETSSGSTTTRVGKKFFRRVIEIGGRREKETEGGKRRKRRKIRRRSISSSRWRAYTHTRRFFSPLPFTTEAREASFSGVDSRIMFRDHSRSVCHVWDGQFAGGQPVAFFISPRFAFRLEKG